MLCMAGTLTSLGKPYSRLWSAAFDDEFFFRGLRTWLAHGDAAPRHQLPAPSCRAAIRVLETSAGRIGAEVGRYSLRHKEIIGLFDTFCMGMINGVFPQKALADIGMPLEGLSQSDLLAEMALVPQPLREACLAWYEAQGMRFLWGSDPATELTREQVLEQCAMLIAMARFAERFGLSAVGVQYQQGLARCCAASDFAEGAIGSAKRFPIPDRRRPRHPPGQGNPVHQRGRHGHGNPADDAVAPARQPRPAGRDDAARHPLGQRVRGHVLLGLRDLGGGAVRAPEGRHPGCDRLPPVADVLPASGGSTIAGQGKAGRFVWARAHYEGIEVVLHVGTGRAVELPAAEFERRRRATSYEWPLLNCTLDGVGRDELMAGHQSNHITVAYVGEEHVDDVVRAFAAQALTQNIRVFLAGTAAALA